MLRENFQERLQDFKSGTGISYVSITFRGRQENVSDNLQMDLICSAENKTLSEFMFYKMKECYCRFL
jgi:hypothetical protein